MNTPEETQPTAQVAAAVVKPLTKPKTLDLVPQAIRLSSRFVLHDKNKIPLKSDGSRAFVEGTSRSDSWSGTEEQARAAMEKVPHATGLGYDLGSPFAGWDFDDCVTKIRNEKGVLIDLIIDEPIAETLRELNTYAEFSPSTYKDEEERGGIKAFFGTQTLELKKYSLVKPERIELYYTGRYFTITGALVPGCPSEVNPVGSDVLERCIKRHAGAIAASRPKRCRKVREGVDPVAALKKAGLKFHQKSGYLGYHGIDGQPCLIKGEVHQGNGNPRNARCSAFHWDPESHELYHTCLAAGCRDFTGRKTEAALQKLGIDPDVIFEPRAYNFDDDGAASRLIDLCGDDYIYVPEMKTWFRWTGSHWTEDRKETIYARMREVKQSVVEEWKQLADSDDKLVKDRRKQLATEAHRLGSFIVTSNTIRAAQKRTEVATLAEELDRDGSLFNCTNGTIDLERMHFRQARREDLITRCSPVIYDPRAVCPQFDAFLERALPDLKVRTFLLDLVAYSLYGKTWLKILPLLMGPKDTSKSTLMEVLRYVFGDYAVTIGFKALEPTHEGSGANTPDLARLRGVRLVLACESEQDQKLSAATVKNLTGNDRIRACAKYQNPIEFDPTFTMLLATNFPPNIPANDDALWGRVKKIPFDVVVQRGEQDPGLVDKLKAELPGIFNRLLEAWSRVRAYHRRKIEAPDAVNFATAEYRKAVDVVEEWIEDKLEISGAESDRLMTAQLHANYLDWWKPRSKPLTSTKFSRELKRIFKLDEIPHTERGRYIAGVKFKFTERLNQDSEPSVF